MLEEQGQPSESVNENHISQREVIQLLQMTIQQLDGIVNKLSTVPMENLPPREVIETVVANTEVLTYLFGQNPPDIGSPPEVPPPVISPNLPEGVFLDEKDLDNGEPTEPASVEVVPPVTPQGKRKSQRQFNSILPSFWGGKLPNGIVITLIGVMVISLVALSLVFIFHPSSEVAQTPTSVMSPTAVSSPEVPSLLEDVPESISEEAIETPPEIEAPGNPEPIAIAPPPEPELTPEQSLIAAIQNEVSDLARRYPEGLIDSIEANFFESRLMITLGEDWYGLNPSRQDNLANGLLKRSRSLDFRKVELLDQEGTAIARSPVVGEDMVILKRNRV